MIPKNIYITYKDYNFPPYIISNLKKLNPSYNIYFYDDINCKEFIYKEYGEKYYNIFNSINSGPIKSDFWRCCILYKYGGFYTDMDQEFLEGFDMIFKDDLDFIITWEPNQKCFNPGFIGCHSKCKLIKECLKIYEKKYDNKIIPKYWNYSIVPIFNNIFLSNYSNKIKTFKKNYLTIKGLNFLFLEQKNKGLEYYKLTNCKERKKKHYHYQTVVGLNKKPFYFGRYLSYDDKKHTF